MLADTRKEKRCQNKACGKMFKPYKTTDKVCSLSCAVAFGVNHVEADRRAKLKAERKETREKLYELKKPKDLIPSVQAAFNKMIRARDKDQPCISCGREYIPEQYGGSWDCGHFLGVGSHPELRFEPMNAYRQCKSCNGGSNKYAKKGYTVAKDYEERLIARIGQAAVDWLKSPHEAKHYTKDDLEALKKHFNQKARELMK